MTDAANDQRFDNSYPVPASPGADEMNLAEFPFATLRTVSDSRNVISHEGWVTGKDGQRHFQKWEVTGSSKAGLPTEYDERVFIALLSIAASTGFASEKVPFSVYEVLKIMGSGTRKSDYRKVERALDRLVGVTIYAEGAFWDNELKTRARVKTGFHIIDKYWLAYKEEDERVRTREGVQGYVIWSEDIWGSIQAGYIKRLDLDQFYGLSRPLARRLYRFLDKRMHYQNEYEIDIFELASRLGMTRYTAPSKVLEKLRPAIEELIADAYLRRTEVRKVKKYTRLYFERHGEPGSVEVVNIAEQPAQERADLEVVPLSESGPPAEIEVIEQLKAVGLSTKVSHRLIAIYGSDRVEEKLDYLKWIQAHSPNMVERPAGWLRRAIEQNYAPPDGYSSAEPRGPLQGSLFAEMFDDEVTRVAEESESEAMREEVYVATPPPYEKTLWTDVLHVLEGQMARSTYDSLLRHTTIARIEGDGRYVISVPSSQSLEWLEHRFKPLVARAIQHQTGEDVTVVFEGLE